MPNLKFFIVRFYPFDGDGLQERVTKCWGSLLLPNDSCVSLKGWKDCCIAESFYVFENASWYTEILFMQASSMIKI